MMIIIYFLYLKPIDFFKQEMGNIIKDKEEC